ncbi:MAG: Hpt domain-containing protein, partial [Synergistetes bacterium]|nr:Hpt domain-containing protein [Synergistota bacterium]
MDLSQYMDTYLEESADQLQRLNELLLDLEKSPTELSILNEVFRVAHTLKGMSATMGFN